MTRQYHYPGIEASYDNKIKFRLNRLAKIESLKEGELYQFQVKVWDNWDGSIISEWENAIFRFDDGINVPPLPPDDILKPDSEILATSTPYLYWLPGYDSDISDRLRYQVILNQNKDFKSRTYIILETPYNTTEIEVKNPLLENRQYFWKVRSIDMSDAKSEWSRTGSFWVNSINEPPFGPIELISPSSLSEVRLESGFWWLKGSDPDPGDRVSYILEIDKEPDFKSPVIKHQIERHSPDAIWSETSSKPPNAIGFPLNIIPDHTVLKDNALYYWRVTVIDNKGLKHALTDNPPRFAYNLLNDPPSAVKAGFRPSGGEIIKTLTPQINWDQATDPDFTDYHRTLMYQVELSSQTLFSPKNTRLYPTSPGENFLKMSESLEENCEYFYRVRVQDSHGAYSPWSHIQSFITNATEEPPNPVTKGFLPKDSMIVKSRTPLISWLPSDDPDPEETERVLHYIIRYTPISGTKKVSQIVSKVGITSVHSPPLQENQYYSYQVAAVDPRGIQSEWSKPIVFGVNSQEQPPEPFSIISPLFNEDSVSTDAAFIWRSTYDFDPGSDINYHLYYSTDNLFITNTEIVVIAPQGGDSIVYNPLVEFSYFTRYYWKLAAVDNTGNRRWASNSDQHPFVFRIAGPRRHTDISFAPAKFYLYQNYPNPFNEKTLIKYETAEYCHVRVTIYDLLGKMVRTLVSGNHAQGIYDTYWNGRDLNGSLVPGGMYLCQIEAGGFTSHRKIVLLR